MYVASTEKFSGFFFDIKIRCDCGVVVGHHSM